MRMRTENITQRNQSNDWKQYLPSQVDEAVVQAIEETLFRNQATFQQATEANKRFIIQKLAKIFSYSFDKYKITPERVYLLNLRGQIVVSLHYLVYLKLAAQSGVIVVRFERSGDGEKVILRHRDDDIEREYFLDYAQYKNRGGVWQTHFDVMFRKTLLKQAIMFLFADVYENEVFSEVANLEEDDLVEPPKVEVDNTASQVVEVPQANGVGKVDTKEARKKNTKLYAKINQLKAIFASDKELLREYEAFLRLKGYKSALDITDENELKDLHALAEALAEHKQKGIPFGDALDLRDKVLLRLMNAENKAAIKPQILSILSQYGYDTISEVGRMEVLEKLYSLVENSQNLTQNGTEKAQDRLF